MIALYGRLLYPADWLILEESQLIHREGKFLTFFLIITLKFCRKVFWADWNREAPKIEWANMDGSNREVFVEGPRVKLPNSLSLDFSTDELCWADAGTFSIGKLKQFNSSVK